MFCWVLYTLFPKSPLGEISLFSSPDPVNFCQTKILLTIHMFFTQHIKGWTSRN